MKRNPVIIRVDPEFRKTLKVMAAREDTSITKLTKHLAKKLEELAEDTKNVSQRKRFF